MDPQNPTSNIPAVRKDTIEVYSGKQALISAINYPNGTRVEFNYDQVYSALPFQRVLASIKIKSGLSPTTTNAFTYRLNHAYFAAGSATEAAYPIDTSVYSGFNLIFLSRKVDIESRLKLKSIDKIGTDNTNSERLYSFDYDPTPLPERLSPSKDIYGFYNGQACSPLTIPIPNTPNFETHYLEVPYHTYIWNGGNTYNYGVNRNSDFNYAKACVLNRITNGAGGQVNFKYKAHVLSNILPTDPSFVEDPDLLYKTANDGICIDTIQSKDELGNSVITKYDFTGGIRFFRGGFFTLLPQTGSLGQTYYNFMLVANENFNGCNHGYSNVTVTQRGYLGEQLSKTDYKFHNWQVDPNLYDTEYPAVTLPLNTPPVNRETPVGSAGFGDPNFNRLYNQRTINPDFRNLGLVMEQKTYDVNGFITSKTQNKYMPSPRPLSYSEVSTRLTRQTVLQYSGTTSAATTYRYTYSDVSDGMTPSHTIGDYYDNVSLVKWLDSKGQERQKFSFYRVDVPGLLYVHKIIDAEYKVVGTHRYMMDYSYVNFNYFPIYPTKVYTSAIDGSYLADATLFANFSDLHVKEYSKRDDHNNVLETYFPAESVNNAYIWDTRIGQKIAEVSGAKYDEIAYTSFEGKFAALPSGDYNRGNWDFDSASVYTTTAPLCATGRCYYPLTTANEITSHNTLETGKEFILSF